jgi:hypothetical protein
MMQQAVPPPGYTVVVPRPVSNNLGIAGFVLSLVGLFACGGLLCPLGALLSFIALFKQPRGFAVAGFIIGMVGSFGFIIFLLLGGLAFMAGVLGFAWLAGPTIQTTSSIVESERIIVEYRDEHGAFPDGIQGNRMIRDHTDGWETPLRYECISDDAFEIRSAGPDRTFDTSDDITFEDLKGQVTVEFNVDGES